MSEKLILVTNDDGITSGGIRALIDVARDYGKVVVVAPDSPQSGMGHAVTLTKPLHVVKKDLFDGIEAYSCSGTPVDCVKWGVHNVLSNQLPDFCLSGINHGANNSINILYSGTMSAAMEGAIQGINSIGFSSFDFNEEAKGLRISRQANARWIEDFVESKDQFGRKEYQITGKFVNNDSGEDCDVWALKNGYVSVVPVQFDLTSHPDLAYLSDNWNLKT